MMRTAGPVQIQREDRAESEQAYILRKITGKRFFIKGHHGDADLIRSEELPQLVHDRNDPGIRAGIAGSVLAYHQELQGRARFPFLITAEPKP